VRVDHERQIAEQGDSVGCRTRTRVLPLRARDPLQVLVEEDVVAQFAPRRVERLRRAVSQRRRPLGPRRAVFPFVNGAEQHVIVEPPGLVGDVSAECVRACSARAPFVLDEALEGGAQGALFQRPHGRVLDPRRAPDVVEFRTVVRVERALAPAGRELVDRTDVDEDRIDGHRAHRGVRRLMAG
jgi:hypothetical protein